MDAAEDAAKATRDAIRGRFVMAATITDSPGLSLTFYACLTCAAAVMEGSPEEMDVRLRHVEWHAKIAQGEGQT